MERKVGEIFSSNGETFITIENNSAYCYGCCFEGKNCGAYDTGKCYVEDRSDGHGVIFKRLMDFSHALHYLKNGAVVRRKSWSGNKSIFLAKDMDGMLPFFCINTKDGHKGVYTGTACDLLAEDWEVIEE